MSGAEKNQVFNDVESISSSHTRDFARVGEVREDNNVTLESDGSNDGEASEGGEADHYARATAEIPRTRRKASDTKYYQRENTHAKCGSPLS